jgi:L,D-transpeptidase ErfK/SrfK
MTNNIKYCLNSVCGILLFITICSPSWAVSYMLQNRNDSVIGEIISTRAELKDTLLDIARAYSLGYHDIKLLNPELDTWMPGEGQEILLPLQFVLPNTDRKGIVLNIPEMRLYYYPEGKGNGDFQVITYPLGVGRQGWSTPYMKTRIIEKKKHPNWYPPESIRAEHEEAGDPLPKIVKAGPDNPLGDYALRLGRPEYLIHGTNKPYGVGMRVSHGCIRLYPEDIEYLFNNVKLGTSVNIVNQPYKVGERNGVVYLEAHQHLDEDNERFSSLTEIVKLVIEMTKDKTYEIDWNLLSQVVEEHKGVPVAIGLYVPEMQASIEEELLDTPVVTKTHSNGVELRLDTNISRPTEIINYIW